MINYFIIFNSIFQIFLASFVLIKKSRSATNLLFVINAYLISIWSLTFVLKNLVITNHQVLIVTRIMLLFPLLYSFSFFEFARTIPNRIYKANKKLLLPILIFIIISTIMLPTKAFIISASKINGQIGYQYGYLYRVYGIYTLLLSMSGAFIIFYKQIRAEGIIKKQLQYTFIGIILTALTSLILNVLLPLFNNNKFIDIGACASIFYISFFSYAILKHNLLDIKRFIQDTVVNLVLFIVYTTVLVFTNIYFKGNMYWLIIFISITVVLGIILLLDYFRNKRMDRIMQHRLGMYKEQIENYSVLDSLRNTLYGQVHDLNNPINLLVAYSSDIKDAIKEKDMDEVEHAADVLSKNAQVIKTEISKLLNKLNIDFKNSNNSYETAFYKNEDKCNLFAVVDKCVDDMQDILNYSNVVLYNNIDPNFRVNYLSTEMVSSIIKNLISNSVKALKDTQNPSITVSIKKTESSYYEVEFHDNGKGIEDLDKVFKVGYSTFGSSGHGLAMTKQVIQAPPVDGDVFIKSDKKGTTIVLKLKGGMASE